MITTIDHVVVQFIFTKPETDFILGSLHEEGKDWEQLDEEICEIAESSVIEITGTHSVRGARIEVQIPYSVNFTKTKDTIRTLEQLFNRYLKAP